MLPDQDGSLIDYVWAIRLSESGTGLPKATLVKLVSAPSDGLKGLTVLILLASVCNPANQLPATFISRNRACAQLSFAFGKFKLKHARAARVKFFLPAQYEVRTRIVSCLMRSSWRINQSMQLHGRSNLAVHVHTGLMSHLALNLLGISIF